MRGCGLYGDDDCWQVFANKEGTPMFAYAHVRSCRPVQFSVQSGMSTLHCKGCRKESVLHVLKLSATVPEPMRHQS